MSRSSVRRRGARPPLEAELELLEWGARGSTQADLGGRRIVVDGGIPGEKVAALVDRSRRPWRGRVERILEVAPGRVAAPCPYYERDCGGCQLQHVSYAFQLRVKEQTICAELRHNGIVRGVDRVSSMTDPWRYRRTAALAIGWEAGFRPRGRRGIVEIHDCAISHPLIGGLADALNGLLRSGAMPNYHGRVWLDCRVTGSDAEPRLQILLQGIEGLTLEAHPELPAVAATLSELPHVVSVAYRHRSGEARPLVGGLFDTLEVAGRELYLPAGSFFQTNIGMLERLLGRMREKVDQLRQTGRRMARAVDLYGGVGTFALALATQVERMSLVELDSQAVEAARMTASAWGLDNLDFVDVRTERALPALPSLDLAIVDPPRSGLGATVVDTLAANGVPAIFYVSCSPASLAVDLARLQEHGFAIEWLEMLDFYPQTYHVECFAVLVR